MIYYNYRICYDNKQVTELLKCDCPLDMTKTAKWYKINYTGQDKSIAINMEKVTTIEEWITEE